MKITKRQLRRIIKEEKAKLQKEWTPADAGFAAARDDDRRRGAVRQGDPTQALGALHSAIDDLIKILGNEEAYLELQGIVEDWQ
jgi:hypothetical protein